MKFLTKSWPVISPERRPAGYPGDRRSSANINPHVQSDCLKVLYEIGYLKPAGCTFAEDFLKLLRSRNNCLVWGSMIALSTIAGLEPRSTDSQYELLLRTIEEALSSPAMPASRCWRSWPQQPARSERIFPYLLMHLQTCRPATPQRAENILQAVDAIHSNAYIEIPG
jgi:hypothetical protein